MTSTWDGWGERVQEAEIAASLLPSGDTNRVVWDLARIILHLENRVRDLEGHAAEGLNEGIALREEGAL